MIQPPQIKKALINSLLIATTSMALTACFHDEDDSITPSIHYAVVSTSTFPDSDVSIISLEDYSVKNDVFDTQADISVSTNKGNFYVVGRLGTDNITKYHIDTPETNEWQFSVGQVSNPYQFVVKDDTTAYVIRNNADNIWIVDPSVADDDEANFKKGELDLTPYSTNDNKSEAANGIIVNNKLYVLIQNLNNFVPETAYVAIFDLNTNAEIATNSDSSTPMGISLKTTNPEKMVFESASNMLYIASTGAWTPDYTGGIESININTYATELVIDDGVVDDAPYGLFRNIAVLSKSRGYFVGLKDFDFNTGSSVYSFNPTTKEVDPTPVLTGMDISDIEMGPLGNLWVTDRGNTGIKIINTVDNTVLEELISTDLPPTNIEFISVPK